MCWCSSPARVKSAGCSHSCRAARCRRLRECCRCTVSCVPKSRTRHSRPPPPVRARWCWPRTSPKPVSPSRAFASWSTRASSAARYSIPSPAWGGWRPRASRVRRPTSARGARAASRRAWCYRAWSEGAQRSLAAFSAPEILQTDLAGLALELAAWGVVDAATLVWLDPPPAATLASARNLLHRLDALDDNGASRHMGARWPGCRCIRAWRTCSRAARDLGCVPLAAQLAALLSERDLLRAREAPAMRTCVRVWHCCRGRASRPAWTAAPCSARGAAPGSWPASRARRRRQRNTACGRGHGRRAAGLRLS